MQDTSKKALVVDDDPEIRDFVSAVLEMDGWTVSLARDGREACQFVAQDCPDLIIMDVMMPIKNGFDAFKEIREDERTSFIPIILLTAVNEFELGAHYSLENVGQRLGVPYPEGFLDKPVDSRLLLKAVAEALSSR